MYGLIKDALKISTQSFSFSGTSKTILILCQVVSYVQGDWLNCGQPP